MKSIKRLAYMLFTLAIVVQGCSMEEISYNPSDWAKVYMPQAVNRPNTHLLVMADTPQVIVYGAAYAGVDYPQTDLQVQFKVEPDKVAAYNEENGTSYQAMPTGSYELLETGSIPAGKANTAPMQLYIHTIDALEPIVDYLLPVSITHVDGDLSVNPLLQTTYFHIRAVYVNYSRDKWDIVAVSSQGGTEGAANERIEHAFDDNVNTFWHSQWQGNRPGPPHFFTVDMGETNVVHGVAFSARRNAANGRFKRVRIELSINGTDWQDAGSFELANVDENTVYLDNAVGARFLRVWIDEAHGNITTSLAELNVF